MEIWVIVAVAAAGVQTLRLMLQEQLKSVGLSTGGASLSRFLFAAPLAIVALLIALRWLGIGPPAAGWAAILLGAFAILLLSSPPRDKTEIAGITLLGASILAIIWLA